MSPEQAAAEIEYGRFTDPLRTYVITSSFTPDTIRVYAGEPRVCETVVCTISNVSIHPIPAFGGLWVSNTPDWKQRFCAEAVRVYRQSTRRSSPHYRHCDG